MPLLQVIGVPSDARMHLSVTTYRHQELPLAAASIPDMGVTTDLVTVHIPEDDGLNGKEVIVLILGLFRKERPKRTDVVVQAFAEALLEPTVAMVRSALPECTKIEVFDPANIDPLLRGVDVRTGLTLRPASCLAVHPRVAAGTTPELIIHGGRFRGRKTFLKTRKPSLCPAG